MGVKSQTTQFDGLIRTAFPQPERISVCAAPACGSFARAVPMSSLGLAVTRTARSASAGSSLPTAPNPLPALTSREGRGPESQWIGEYKWQRLLVCCVRQSRNRSFWGCKEEGCLQKVQVKQNGRKLTTHRVLRMDPFLVYEKAESCFFFLFSHHFSKVGKKVQMCYTRSLKLMYICTYIWTCVYVYMHVD